MLYIFLAIDIYDQVYYQLIAVIYEYSYCSLFGCRIFQWLPCIKTYSTRTPFVTCWKTPPPTPEQNCWVSHWLEAVRSSEMSSGCWHTRWCHNPTAHIAITELFSTRSPFVTLLSRSAQSGRWSCYRQTGVVHRITFSFSHFPFYLRFIYSVYWWYKITERCIQ